MVGETFCRIFRLIRAEGLLIGLLLALPAHASDEAPSRAATAPGVNQDDEVRRRLLLKTLPETKTTFLDVAPVVVGTVALAGTVAFWVDNHDQPTTTGSILVATCGLTSAYEFGSYLAPRALRPPMVVSASSLWFSGFAFALANAPELSTQARQVMGIAAGTSALEAALPLVDAALETPPDLWAFDRDRKALETADSSALHGHIVHAEQNLARTRRPLRFVGPFVYLAGVTGMTIAAVREPHADDATKLAVAWGLMFSTFATIQLVSAVSPGAQRYERALRDFKLVPVGPRGSAGLSATWRF